MASVQWLTNSGNLGAIPLYNPVTIELQAADYQYPNSTVTYKIIQGSLPSGLTLNSNGTISGSAVSGAYFTSETFNFLVRASSDSASTPVDRSFNITVNGTVNGDLDWITPSGSLGIVPAGTYYQLPLEVVETQSNVSVTFSLVSGVLPGGMIVNSAGYLQGVPELLNAIAVDQSTSFDFTIRATNSLGHIKDRAFSLTVTNVTGPVIQPTINYLGSYFDGTHYSQQLTVAELNPNVVIQWSNIGSLPPGITLDNTGLLSGYLLPSTVVGPNGPAGYDSDVPAVGGSGAILDYAEYDYAPYDFNQLSQTISYNFTVQAYDGANYDLQNYIINVISRSAFTADNANLTVDNSYITTDAGNVYIPVIVNANVTLPTARAGAYYAYKFTATDFQNDPLIYSITNTVGTFDAYVLGQDAGFDFGGDDITHLTGVGFDSYASGTTGTNNLPGLILDQQSGWLYGKVNPQSSAYDVYTFGLQASRTVNGLTYSSTPIYFNLPVLGNINDVIEWTTNANLGVIDNGSVSDLYVEAVAKTGNPLTYSLVDQANVKIRLPQGLALTSQGELEGRVTFEAFTLDSYATSIDANATTIDRQYVFTVEATDGNISSTQQFTLTMVVADQKPYDNLYLRALPDQAQRKIWYDTITNTEIFPPALIYRPDDPRFGVQQNIEMLFLPGLSPDDLNTYANAIAENHYTKNFAFGNVKTAVVLDNNYSVKYEVVYVEVIDPGLNSLGQGPALEIDLAGVIANPYKDSAGNSYNIAYPNSSPNMIDRLVANVGYYDQGSLPPWMTSNQLGTVSNSFAPPLGFTKAVVLAYAKPGAGDLIAYRLQNSGIDFNSIDFTVDRYFVDDYYTTNFNTASSSYYLGRETTFDSLPNQNIGELTGTVYYGATVPFDQINGRTVDYINSQGGISGVTNFQSGDTLIFVQQENFLNAGPYDGWVSYQDAFLGDNILTPVVEGYDSEAYDKYSLIPGFLEKSQGTSAVNERGGIWQIQIVNNVVDLVFVQEIEIFQRVRVLFGQYGGAIMYYNFNLSVGQTVPYYIVYNYNTIAIRNRTTFNGDSTKFFDLRDQYYAPGTNDHILHFPKENTFV